MTAERLTLLARLQSLSSFSLSNKPHVYKQVDNTIGWIPSSREKRNMEAAQRFFKHAVDVVGHAPEQVTTDGHTSYPRAIRETMDNNGQHRTNKYLKNRLEQDHRGIKQREYPMRGFGTVEAAARFCRDARRIAQLPSSASHPGRSDLSPGTTIGFSPASC